MQLACGGTYCTCGCRSCPLWAELVTKHTDTLSRRRTPHIRTSELRMQPAALHTAVWSPAVLHAAIACCPAPLHALIRLLRRLRVCRWYCTFSAMVLAAAWAWMQPCRCGSQASPPTAPTSSTHGTCQSGR
eukprot:354653-Chlamydomonas_euryale.AAC.2